MIEKQKLDCKVHGLWLESGGVFRFGFLGGSRWCGLPEAVL